MNAIAERLVTELGAKVVADEGDYLTLRLPGGYWLEVRGTETREMCGDWQEGLPVKARNRLTVDPLDLIESSLPEPREGGYRVEFAYGYWRLYLKGEDPIVSDFDPDRFARRAVKWIIATRSIKGN